MEKQANINKKFSEKNQKVVYEIARKFGGETTVSDIYANSNLSVEEIENILSELYAKNFIHSELDEKTSVIKYTFPDIKKDFINKKNNFIENTGIDKVLLRLKYRSSKAKPIDDIEKAILQTAQIFKGELTMGKIVEYTELSVDDARDILTILSFKGLCKRETNEDFNNPLYYFPEIVQSVQDKKNENENNKNKLIGFAKDFSYNILNKFKKNTDKMIIKGKVQRYRKKLKKSLFFDGITPGLGHLMSKQWSGLEYSLFILFPSFLTAGFSLVLSPFLLRYETLKYYSLSERDLKNKSGKVNFNSLIYTLILTSLYYNFIGLQGIINYYSYILSILGF